MAADHKMTRHEMKQDDLVTFMEKARRYADKNPTQVRNAAIGAAILLVAAVAAYYMITGRASAAATLLRQGEDQFGAPVAGSETPPSPSGPSFTAEGADSPLCSASSRRISSAHIEPPRSMAMHTRRLDA